MRSRSRPHWHRTAPGTSTVLGATAGVAAGLIASLAPEANAQARRFDFTVAASHAAGPAIQGAAFDPTIGHGLEPAQGDLAVFSLVVPEGDYRVTVTPLAGRTATVWAERRRLMLESASEPSSFTVNVRRPDLPAPPPNAPGGDRVRLNSREVGSRSSDDRLTIVMQGPVTRLDIAPVDVPRLVLLGDSTVADQGDGDYASWGQVLPEVLDDGISVASHAESGETLKSFLTSLRLDKALSQVRPGDIVLIQFGHNDSKAHWPQTYADAATTYRTWLRAYIEEVRRRGARPVLVTSPHRRTFTSEGRIENSHGGYPDAVRSVALEQGVDLVDLTAVSARLYEALGPEGSRIAFGDSGRDGTHHNLYGARLLALAVATRLRELMPDNSHVRPGVPRLDPDRPPLRGSLSLPLMVGQAAPTPAGS